MRFKAIAFIQVSSLLAGVAVGVIMAWLKYGYWSLVGMNVVTNASALLMTWSVSSWRPRSFAWFSGTRSLLHFGAHLTAGSFLYSLARGLDGLLIGRFFGAFSTGLYSRAAALLIRPLEQFMSPIEAVFVPTLSRLQAEPDRYRMSFLGLYESIAVIGFLLTGMCFGLAHPLTLVILGPKWEGAAVIFAGFTLAALQYPLTNAATWLFASQGRGRDSFVASSLISIVVAGSFVAGLPFGPTGVAIAYSASCILVQMPILYYIVGRAGPVSAADLWVGFLKQMPLWAVASLVTWLARLPIPDDRPLTELAIATPCGLLAGAVFIFAYAPARRVALHLYSALREYFSSYFVRSK
jgi:PST family polysaccharide transporter